MDGTVIERLIVEWRADYEKFARDSTRIKAYLGDTRAAAATTSAGFTSASTASSSLGTSFAALGAKAMLLGGALQALRVSVSEIKEAVKLAMDVTESESLFETSLGSMSDSVRAWSESMAESLGVNADEVRRTTGLWYTLGKSLELDSENALSMSKSLQQLKFDLMSFYNIEGSQADTIIQGMYSGETEPAKRIGVLLTEEAAKRALVTRGLVEEGEELSSVMKLQGRYLALMDQTTTAQGDMARTIDSPANQMRVLESQFRAARLELGQAFLPLLKEVIPVLKSFASNLRDLSEAVGTIVDAFSGRKTFGLKEQVSAVGAATAAGTSGWDAYGDAAGKALDKATAGAIKLKATIFGFDLLNVMSDDKATGDVATGGSPGKNALLPNISADDILPDTSEIDPRIEEYKEKIDKFVQWINEHEVASRWLALTTPVTLLPLLYGDVISTIIDLSQPLVDVELLPPNLAEDTKAKLEPFLQQFMDVETTIKQWAWGNQEITSTMASTMASAITEMARSIKTTMQDNSDESYRILKENFRGTNALTEKEEQAILNKIIDAGEDRQEEVDKTAKRISEIYQNAADENREITDEEQREINKLLTQMKETAVETMSSSAQEQTRILYHLKESAQELSAMQAADIVKNSLAAKVASIDAANETADQVIEAAWRQKQAGVITDEEYKKIVAAAEKARDDSIAAAETTHENVVEEAKLQAGDHVKWVNWETGEMRTKWDVLWEALRTGWNDNVETISGALNSMKEAWDNVWGGLFDSVKGAWKDIKSLSWSDIWEEIKDSFMENFEVDSNSNPDKDPIWGKNSSGYTGVRMETYATGGLPEVGEVFIAREAGPEPVGRIGSKTAVANNDQIVSAFETAFYRAARAAQSNGNGSPLQLQVFVGNKTVYDVFIDEAARQNIRAGKSVIQVEA